MRYGSAQILSNGSMSGNIKSFGVDVQQEWVFSIQALWSGITGAQSGGVGTLGLEISNDNVNVGLQGTDPAVNVKNWTTFSSTLSSTSASAGSSSFLWNISDPGFRWVRLSYTASSATGILSANYFGKGV